MTALSTFKHCVEAIRGGSLIERVSKPDKEYHVQYWFMARLAETGLNFEMGAGTATRTSGWSPLPEVMN
jgi:hypothetical protein